jgi:hypothetical protein
VKKRNERFRKSRTDLFDDSMGGTPLLHDLNEAIHSMLTERPFWIAKKTWSVFFTTAWD